MTFFSTLCVLNVPAQHRPFLVNSSLHTFLLTRLQPPYISVCDIFCLEWFSFLYPAFSRLHSNFYPPNLLRSSEKQNASLQGHQPYNTNKSLQVLGHCHNGCSRREEARQKRAREDFVCFHIHIILYIWKLPSS